jgi:formate-nitrite transporter family protein
MSTPDLGPGEEETTEPQKPYRQILVDELDTGLAEFRRPTLGLLLSSLSGGLDVSFSLLMMLAMWTLVHDAFGPALTKILVANMYAVGFIFVVLGRSELFTEHTSRAMFPVISGYATWPALLRLWGLVYAGNLIGVVAFSGLLAAVAVPLGIAEPQSFAALADPLIGRNWWLTLVSGTLAGWMMGLLSWLVSACRDTISQIVVVWLVTASIGLAGIPHAIVGAGEVLVSVLAGAGASPADFLQFQFFTTIGNSIGGVVFVAALKYGHSTRDDRQSESGGRKKNRAPVAITGGRR